MGAHESLFVYRKSIDAVRACEAVARAVERGRPDLADQLRRASCSIPFNIAEGAAEMSTKEKLRFYRIARRSSGECGAILEVISISAAPAPPTEAARRAVNETFALLVRTAKSLEG